MAPETGTADALEGRVALVTGASDPATGLGLPAELIGQIEEQIPIGRPDDVAEACLWLASEASDYRCGQVIQLHGGREIMELV